MLLLVMWLCFKVSNQNFFFLPIKLNDSWCQRVLRLCPVRGRVCDGPERQCFYTGGRRDATHSCCYLPRRRSVSVSHTYTHTVNLVLKVSVLLFNSLSKQNMNWVQADISEYQYGTSHRWGLSSESCVRRTSSVVRVFKSLKMWVLTLILGHQ